MVYVKGTKPEARHQHRLGHDEPQEAPREQVGEVPDHEAEHVQVHVQEIILLFTLYFLD